MNVTENLTVFCLCAEMIQTVFVLGWSVAWGGSFDLLSYDVRDASDSLVYFHREVRGQAQLLNVSLEQGEL